MDKPRTLSGIGGLQYYYMNDPYNSNGLRAYERSVVEARYAALGYQAVAITSI